MRMGPWVMIFERGHDTFYYLRDRKIFKKVRYVLGQLVGLVGLALLGDYVSKHPRCRDTKHEAAGKGRKVERTHLVIVSPHNLDISSNGSEVVKGLLVANVSCRDDL